MPSTSSVAGAALAVRIIEYYGLHSKKFLPAQKGYRNRSIPANLYDGRTVNIVIYKSEQGIVRTVENANAVSGYLAAQKFPARRTIDTRIIRLRRGQATEYASLYHFLPGHTIAWEAYTQKHIKLLGKTMSDMHAALYDFDTAELPDVTEIYLQIVSRMLRYFELPGVRHALDAKLGLNVSASVFAEFEKLLLTCKNMPHQQALHMDFVRGNILFHDTEDGPCISGIIDFEKTARGNPLCDIARTLAFLLVDCKYKPIEKVRKYFLFSGYDKRGKAELPKTTINTIGGTIEVLESLVNLFLMYDFYKFLKHNPYEFLHQNEHFVRTQALLLQRCCIAKSTN